MSGVEEFVRRAQRKPGERPLKMKLAEGGRPKVGADGITCPVCSKPNAGIDWAPHRTTGEYTALYWCRRCQTTAPLSVAAERLGLTWEQVQFGNEHLLTKCAEELVPPEIDAEEVERWAEQLWLDEDRMRFLNEKRLISCEVIRRRKIGHDGERYVIPVWEGGKLVNLRRYHPSPPDPRRKILSLGNSGAHLYPDVPDDDAVVLCEGEWDALAAESLGLPSLTNTGGALCWREEKWSPLLAGKRVFIVYDRDATGVAGAEKVSKSLRSVCCEVVSVVLPMRYRVTHGPDVTDFLRTGSDLRALLRAAWRERQRPRPVRKPRPLPVTTATARRRFQGVADV